MKEGILHKTIWKIRKFKTDEDYKANNSYAEEIINDNICLNVGINLLWKIMAGDKPGTDSYFDNSNSYIGVGDSSTAESASQTALLGTNKFFKAMDTSYPTYGTDQKITFKSTFGVSDANFSWQEFGIANYDMEGAGTGTLFNRKTSNKGTKMSGEIWEITLTITLS